jgi:hypothetical protein
MTQSGVVAGTPLFMAPEQAMGRPVDQRSDLFSLGSVLYALCTGRPPFRSSTMMGVIRRVCDEQARPIREINPDVPDWLCGIIARLLSKNPDDRFQTADEIAELLAGCLAHVQEPLQFELPRVARELQAATHESASSAPAARPGDVERPVTSYDAQFIDERTGAGAEQSTRRYLPVNELHATASQLVKWPALLLFMVGMMNALFMLLFASYQMTQAGGPNWLELAVTTAIVLTPCTLCMIGAVRFGSLRSRVWSYIAACTAIIGGPAIVLGLPIGIWAMLRLGRPEVVAGFANRSKNPDEPTSRDLVPLPDPPTFGQSLARVLITLTLLLISVTLPIGLILSLAYSGPDPLIGPQLATIIGFGATSLVFALIALLRRTFGKKTDAAAVMNLKKDIMPQLRRVPEVVLCTFLAVITLGSIYNDLTASNYDWFMEATIIPLVCVTLVSVVLVAFVNLRRIRELEASGQKDEELATAFRTAIWTPVGILVPVLVLFGVWIYFQGTVGYVTYDVDDEWSNVAFRNTETGEIHERIAMWKRCRLKVGTYDWTVSDSELRHAILASGTITVQPRVSQVLSVHVTPEESLQRLVGLWKYQSGNAHWPSATVEALTRLPGGMAITRDGDEFSLQYHYPDGSAAESLLLEVEANSKPRRLRLLNRNSTGTATVAAQGIWSVSQNTLSLMLHSLEHAQMPSRQSVPVSDYVKAHFDRAENSTQPPATTEK